MRNKRRPARNNTNLPTKKDVLGNMSRDSSSLSCDYQTPKADSDNDARGKSSKHWLEYATASFALVAALGSISSGVVGYWQWSVMSGQLAVMQADQRPYIKLTEKISQPAFVSTTDNDTGQVWWNVEYANVGKSSAINFSLLRYMRVGGVSFRSGGAIKGSASGPIPKMDIRPSEVDWTTIVSPEIVKREAFTQLMAVDQGSRFSSHL